MNSTRESTVESSVFDDVRDKLVSANSIVKCIKDENHDRCIFSILPFIVQKSKCEVSEVFKYDHYHQLQSKQKIAQNLKLNCPPPPLPPFKSDISRR